MSIALAVARGLAYLHEPRPGPPRREAAEHPLVQRWAGEARRPRDRRGDAGFAAGPARSAGGAPPREQEPSDRGAPRRGVLRHAGVHGAGSAPRGRRGAGGSAHRSVLARRQCCTRCSPARAPSRRIRARPTPRCPPVRAAARAVVANGPSRWPGVRRRCREGSSGSSCGWWSAGRRIGSPPPPSWCTRSNGPSRGSGGKVELRRRTQAVPRRSEAALASAPADRCSSRCVGVRRRALASPRGRARASGGERRRGSVRVTAHPVGGDLGRRCPSCETTPLARGAPAGPSGRTARGGAEEPVLRRRAPAHHGGHRRRRSDLAARRGHDHPGRSPSPPARRRASSDHDHGDRPTTQSARR